MSLKNMLLSFCVLITFSRCNSDCGGIINGVDEPAVPSISFSIMDVDGNDLIDNGLYDPSVIELRTANGEKINLHYPGSNPERAYISNYNESLESFNNSEYFLYLNDADTDTIGLNVTKMFNQCNTPYYESNSFIHNGIPLEEFDSPTEPYFILIKQ